MTLSLSNKGVKLQKHNQYRHAGPRSGISCLYQRLEIPHQVRDDALFELKRLYITKFNDLISNSR